MALQIERDPDGLIVARASGEVARQEFDHARFRVIEWARQDSRPLMILVRIEEDFSNLEAMAAWHEDDHHDEFLQQRVGQLAIVGEEKWGGDAYMFFLGGLLPFPVKYFPPEHEPLARAWLGQL
ncbi:SpoIIAA-like protein [Fluviicoccus keumensis]|uniref:SpoIIAA-like protein n=1 Tax=Fluviicoccus keumensis TaxID=1435465 RepID=A0A4Q7ZCK8_9GAMM|nr:STAS/SEC14 domain-containing protein [Fluviicoccus keumensis]RZU47881.1 SpoIIAA-like protein [Fluviicoccus keumensis]